MTGDRESRRLEMLLGHVLQIGSIVSTSLLAVGLALSLAAPGYGAAGRFLDLGLMTLMATPVARVIVSVVEYAHERDWTFVALTATVLLVLGGSLMIAIAH